MKKILLFAILIGLVFLVSGCLGDQVKTKTITEILENPIEGEKVLVKGHFVDYSAVIGAPVCWPLLIPTEWGINFVGETGSSIAVNLTNLDMNDNLFVFENHGIRSTLNGTITAIVRTYNGPACEDYPEIPEIVNVTYLEVLDFVSDTPLSAEEQACIDGGATLSTSLCCLSTEDYPNTCLIGACGCSPDNSHEVNICNCGPGKCWNGVTCE